MQHHSSCDHSLIISNSTISSIIGDSISCQQDVVIITICLMSYNFASDLLSDIIRCKATTTKDPAPKTSTTTTTFDHWYYVTVHEKYCNNCCKQ